MKKVAASVLLGILALPSLSFATTLQPEDNIKNTVYIECGNYNDQDVWTPVSGGSGVILSPDHVLTNAHVVADLTTLLYYPICRAGYATSAAATPQLTIQLHPLFGKYDQNFDYALLEPINSAGGIVSFPSWVTLGNPDALELDDDLYVLGYPGIGGSTITITNGSVAGFLDDIWIKSDAPIEHGNSGGGAFDSRGNLVAIPTAVATGELNSLSYLQNINAIFEDMFDVGAVTRDYDHLYSADNQFCWESDCYNLAEDESAYPSLFANIDDNSGTETPAVNDTQTVTVDDTQTAPTDTPADTVTPATDETPAIPLPPEAGKYVPSKFDASLQSRLKGDILLQVEQHGEAWYVNPNDSLRYYMANGDVAYTMMRSFSLGITDSDLAKIPAVDSTAAMTAAPSVCKTNSLANRLRGYILLQVQQHGEAWYIDPNKCQRIYMKDGNVAYDIMRYLSLGVADSDLEKLPSGTIE